MTARAKVLLLIVVISLLPRVLSSLESHPVPRTHPMDPNCVSFAPEFKPTAAQTLVMYCHGSRRCEVLSSMKGVRIPALLFLLILSGNIECNPGPTKPNYKFLCVGCAKTVRPKQLSIECRTSKTGSEEAWCSYRDMRNKVTGSLRQAKRAYFESIASKSNCKCSKGIWKELNRLLG